MRTVFGRFLRIALALAVLFSAAGFSGCGAKDVRRSVTFTDVFDTVTEFTCYGVTEEVFSRASNAVHEELLRIHRLCDPYHHYDGIVNLYDVNRPAEERSFELDPDLIFILETGREFYEKTNGKFNIAMGALTSLWHACLRAEDGAVLPDQDAIRESMAHIGFDHVAIAGRVVTLSDPFLQFDAGGVAKGFAADSAAAVARSCGVEHFALNLGGNVLLSGQKPAGNWTIGVQDPDGGIFTKLSVSDCSVVTSGDYQRYAVIDGVRVHHIIDPDTGFPARTFRSVTVVCSRSTEADALSTSLFCLSLEEGRALARSCGAEALWILSDGSAVRTEGFSDYE